MTLKGCQGEKGKQRVAVSCAARVSFPGKDTGDLNVGCWVESVRQVGVEALQTTLSQGSVTSSRMNPRGRGGLGECSLLP